jgi:hypothetical protein
MPVLLEEEAAAGLLLATAFTLKRDFLSTLAGLAQNRLRARGVVIGNLRALLARCQADECHHRDEATALRGGPPGWLLRGWCALVGAGSAAAVVLARRV